MSALPTDLIIAGYERGDDEPTCTADLLRHLTIEEQQQLLQHLLLVQVKRVYRARRKTAQPRPPEALTTPPPAADTAVVPIQRARSAKVAAIRDGFTLSLDAELYAPDGTKKPLAEFTRKDLLWWSEAMRLKARSHMNAARQFHILASAMAEHRAETVGDLPVSLTRKALEMQA